MGMFLYLASFVFIEATTCLTTNIQATKIKATTL